jgi:hypothetical protein
MTKVEFCRDCRLSTAGNCGNHGSQSPIIGEPRLIEPCYGQCGLTLLRTQLEALEQEMEQHIAAVVAGYESGNLSVVGHWRQRLQTLLGR